MEMDVKKIELLKGLSDVEDRGVLVRVEAIKEGIDKEWKNGYTPEEFKAEMLKRLNSYPWKK